MQNIKNFKSVLPSAVDAKKFGDNVNSIQFLLSEDGRDWYECQSLFSDDTIKIMYDGSDRIVSVVDAPVSQRGNIYAVSMFHPVGMSVAEVAVADYPAECKADGTWVYDGIQIYKREATQQEITEENQREQKSRQSEAALLAFPLQAAVSLGFATTEQEQALKALQQYSVDLTCTDITAMPANWPSLPEMRVCGAAKH